jgi:hypothetical protein
MHSAHVIPKRKYGRWGSNGIKLEDFFNAPALEWFR